MKIFSQVSKIIQAIEEDKEHAYLFLTLTQKNVSDDDLGKTIDDMMKAWNRFLGYKKVKDVVKGSYRGLEITYDKNLIITKKMYQEKKDYYQKLGLKVGDKNPNFDMYHPHFHVVLAVNRNYFSGRNYIKHEDWCEMWQSCMKLDYLPNVDVRRFKASNKKELQKSVSEAAKYTVKDNDFLIPDNPSLQDDTVAILTHALASRRLIAFGGVFKEVHKLLKLDDIETGDLVNVEGEDLRDDVKYYRKVVMWNFGYSNYYINSIILPEDVKRQDYEAQMSRVKPKVKKSYDDLEKFKKNMSNKKLTYSVEEIQKKIDGIDRKVGTGAKEEQK